MKNNNKECIKIGGKRKQFKGLVLLVVLSFLFLILMLGLNVREQLQSQVIINEICSNNETYVLEESGQIEDYIELYNRGKYDCSLDGLYLSDDIYELQKLSLDGIVIPAGGFCIVPCIEEGDSFSINRKGETIYLSNDKGEILEQIEVDKLKADTAYARNAEGKWQIGDCTPNMQNETNSEVGVEQPVLSYESGFYDETFDLEISSAENTTIYYTLDGSIPNEGSCIYEKPIEVYDKSTEPNVWKAKQNVVRKWMDYEPDPTPVPKAFIIRAMAMDNAGNKSDIVTATYFVGNSEYKEENVVSLVVDPAELFDGEKGIYVTGENYDEWYLGGQQGEEPLPNFRQKGRDWEREAVFELFENSSSVLQQDVGVRIQGAGAREKTLKRFSVYARKEYSGSDLFEYSIFDSGAPSHALVLREPVTDVICQELMAGRGLPYLRTKRVFLFLNGEFWEATYIREKYNEQYFEEYYDIEEDDLIVIEGNAVGCGVETDMIYFDEFYRYIEEHDFSDAGTYQELAKVMDIQSYIDFLVTNIYSGNMDIAFEKTKNVVMWRSRQTDGEEYNDGKWRFALYDMDSVTWNSKTYYDVEHRAEINSFAQKPEHADLAYNQSALFVALKQNENFCKQFVLSFMDIMNTYFSPKQAGETLMKYDKSVEEWAEGYLIKRPEYMKKYLAEEFGLTGTVEQVVLHNSDESEGKILINTIIPTMENGSWTGEYFTDYPVTVTAEPAEGYEFIGWTGSIISNEMTIEVPVTEGGIELTAEFQKVKLLIGE